MKVTQQKKFGPLKKTTKPPLNFCTCDSFGFQSQLWLGLRWCDTLSEVSHVIFFIFLVWGPKLLQLQNLGGGFVVFFRGSKLQLCES